MNTVQQSTKAALRVYAKNYLLVFAACFFAQQLFAQPIINSFTPSLGAVGTTVTIKGKNFNATPANNIVYFGAVKASVTAATTTSLTVVVPAGSTYQPISVLNMENGLTGYSTQPFTVTFGGADTLFMSNSFAPQVDFSLRYDDGYNSAIGDLDGDGKPDLALINTTNYSGSVSILKNKSTLGRVLFEDIGDFVDVYSYMGHDIAISDLDGDGKLDMAVTNARGGGDKETTVSVARNTTQDETISFAEKVDLEVGNNPSNISVADADRDGKPDLFIEEDHTVSVVRNTSTPGLISFEPEIILKGGIGNFYNQYAIGDLDGDGRIDVIVGGDYTVHVLRNKSTPGTIAFAKNIDSSIALPYDFTLADIDGDKKPDLIELLPDSIAVFKNTTIGKTISFAPPIEFSITSYLSPLTIGDLDGDGKPDILLGGFSVLKNKSSTDVISFAEEVDLSAPYYFSRGVLINDVDGDGKPDIVKVTGSGINSSVSVLRNQTGALFSVASNVSYIGNSILFTDKSTKATSWKWDFDGDGVFDNEEQNPQHIYTAAGIYNVKLRINSDPQDEYVTPITILPNRGTPYTLSDGGNFETNATDFAVVDNPGYSSFSRGNSTEPGKDSTHSGSNVWVIDINAPYYLDNSTAYLYTPSFNCTATGDYTFSFYAKYAVDNTGDGFRIEYSTDKGNIWQSLGNTVQVNWYDNENPYDNKIFPQGEAFFSLTNATTYKKKTFTTTIFQGNSSVVFRVVFKSDIFLVDAGLAIDDFTLTGPENVVLPISLISFTGYSDNNKNILNWKTSSEINSSRYEVERGFDGNNFEKIGVVHPANSTIGSSYNYADDIRHIYANNFYYRLKMVDKDGSYNYSPVVSINVHGRSEKIALLGNLTRTYINVVTPASLLQKPLQAVVFNINGTIVKRINITNTSTVVYVDKLTAGKYFINFIQDGKIIQTEQFIKQ
ncbi:hypothetical protein BH10BAC2_BH10BAC2_26400 [soil metagenome]